MTMTPNPDAINQQLILRLRDVSHIMRSLYEGRGSQRRILIILQETGPITQHALTKRLGIQPGSASEVIAKLEQAGLITRTPNAADRRTADIALTPEGHCRAAEAAKQRRQRHAEMFACLSDREKADLLALLDKLDRDWSARYPDSRHEHANAKKRR